MDKYERRLARPSPYRSAKFFQTGEKKLGQDKKYWFVKKDSNGVKRWTRLTKSTPKESLKKIHIRKQPIESATLYHKGETYTTLDGTTWVVRINKNGAHRWVILKDDKRSKRKSPKKSKPKSVKKSKRKSVRKSKSKSPKKSKPKSVRKSKRKSPKKSKPKSVRKSKSKSPKKKSRKKTSASQKLAVKNRGARIQNAKNIRKEWNEKYLQQRRQSGSGAAEEAPNLTLTDEDIKILGTTVEDSPRTYLLVRLKERYQNLKGEYSEYLPFYLSSGTNSGTPDVFYPFFGITMSEKQISDEIAVIEYLMKFCCRQNSGPPIKNILDGTQVSCQNGQYIINTTIDWPNALVPNNIGAFILKCGIVHVFLEKYGKNPNFAKFLGVLNQDIFRVNSGTNYNPRLCNNLQKQYSDALSVWYNTGGKEKIETVDQGNIEGNCENVNKEIGENNIFGIDLYEFNKLSEDLPQRIEFETIVQEYENILNTSTAAPDVLQNVKQALDILKDSLRYQTINSILSYTIHVSKL
jgi:hypothetical protein